MRKSSILQATALAVALAGGGFAGLAYANDDVMAHIAAGDVVTPNYTYDGHNMSPLDQINVGNVANLGVAWTLQLGVLDEYEAAPVVVGNMMYIVSPVPVGAGVGQAQNLLALDLSNNGNIVWEFRPDVDREGALTACCGAQTRGLQYAEGKIFFHTLDGQVFGLDAATGEPLWRSIGANATITEHTPGNGIIIGDLYIIGNEGGERGIRGKVSAFDINTGQTQWTMYSMGPDNEVGITPAYHAFYPDNQTSLATWYGDSWRYGGGTVWGYFTYDPDLNMFYYSTGNCEPENPDYRREWGVVNLDENGGLIDYRNNWCAGQLARDATTGLLTWAYGISPADSRDLDEPINTPLVDVDLNGDGTIEHTAMKASRSGYFYVWDRATGELLLEPWAFVYQDYAFGVDMETGRKLYDIDHWLFTDVADRRRYTDYDMPGATTLPGYTGTEVDSCPGNSARNWENDAYSIHTGLFYVHSDNTCRTDRAFRGEYVVGQGYGLYERAGANPGGAQRVPYRDSPEYGQPTPIGSQIMAINPLTSEITWSVEFRNSGRAPLSATAGGLVLQGHVSDGTFDAYNAATGELLWAFSIGSEVRASPVTYMLDGRQYIAAIASSDATGEVNFNAAPDDGARYRRAGSTLFVFTLPERLAGG